MCQSGSKQKQRSRTEETASAAAKWKCGWFGKRSSQEPAGGPDKDQERREGSEEDQDIPPEREEVCCGGPGWTKLAEVKIQVSFKVPVPDS